MDEEKTALAQSVQHLTYVLDLRMSNIQTDIAGFKTLVETKINSIKETQDHFDESSAERIAHLKAIDEAHAMTLKSHHERIEALESKDIKAKAGSYDKTRSWIASVFIGAVSAWIIMNLQSILTWLTSLIKLGAGS